MFTFEDRCNNPGTDTHWCPALDPQTYLKEIHPEIIKKKTPPTSEITAVKALWFIKSYTQQKKKTYKHINSWHLWTSTISIPIDKWAVDINNLLREFRWQKMCNSTFSMTCNSKTQLIPCKVLHWTHLTRPSPYRLVFSQSNTCLRCPTAIEDYFYSFWLCLLVQNFWSEVMNRLSEILGFSIPIWTIITLLHKLSYHKPFLSASLTMAKNKLH